jgi:hypothetical protein
MIYSRSLQILSARIHIFLLFIWLLNDTVFKFVFSGFITGKLSDLIGVYLSPLILTAIIRFFFNQISEKLIFLSSLFLTFVTFFFINYSQFLNDRILGILEIGFRNRGVADYTDLPCLLILSLTYHQFFYSKFRYDQHHTNRLVLLFAFVVFINSPAEVDPQGRKDWLTYLLVTGLSTDAIFLESPKGSQRVTENEKFRFRYVGRNNESSPPSIVSLSFPESCRDQNPIPIETNFALSGSTSDSPTMKFDEYFIRIANDKSMSNVVMAKVCSDQVCDLDLTQLGSGEYFWGVSLRYSYIENCKLYKYSKLPTQTVEKFIK